eukprot:5979701-Amphidinium_carterae.1
MAGLLTLEDINELQVGNVRVQQSLREVSGTTCSLTFGRETIGTIFAGPFSVASAHREHIVPETQDGT